MTKNTFFLLAVATTLLTVGAGCQKPEPTTPLALAIRESPATAVPIDEEFRITNVGGNGKLGDPLTSIFPIYAYMCDISEVTSENVAIRYSKIDFFISKDETNAPAVLLGTTPGGSAGSGECDLTEEESSLKSKLEPGKYKVWAIRYIGDKADKRTADVRFSIKQPKKPVITAKDESSAAKNTLLAFFDHLEKTEFEKAASLTDPNDSSFWDTVKIYGQEKESSAKMLESFCQATQTCLKAKVLKVRQVSDHEYSLTIQFINKDGSTYIFGPCCGETEQDSPSIDTFDFMVKKSSSTFKVVTAPLYRP